MLACIYKEAHEQQVGELRALEGRARKYVRVHAILFHCLNHDILQRFHISTGSTPEPPQVHYRVQDHLQHQQHIIRTACLSIMRKAGLHLL